MKQNVANKNLCDYHHAKGGARALGPPSLGRDQLSDRRTSKRKPTPSTWSLFEEPHWLDCVAPGAWETVEITRDGRIVARMPYVPAKRYGMTTLILPPFTPWLGPWMAPHAGKYTTQLGAHHRLLRELVGQLPKLNRWYIACAPEYTNLHALISEDWSLGVKYTYRIENSCDLDLLWDGLAKSVRNHVKTAEKEVEIVTGSDQLPNLIHCLSKTYEHRNLGHRVPSLIAALERIESGLGPRGQRVILTAIDAKGRPHASSMMVFDDRHTFAIARGSDPEFRKSGANSLLVWGAIRFALMRSSIFDFTGSSIPSIEKFNRSFGARQVPVFTAVKQSHLLSFADGLLGRFVRPK